MTTDLKELVRNSSWKKKYPTTLDVHLPKKPLSQAIEGAKGASKPPAQYIPVEEPTSLRSKARGRILDLLAHGPIVGLVNGLQSIYLDSTPLQNPDGTFNFNGATIQTREGYPDQPYIAGFSAVENTSDVSTELKFATPIVRAVTNNDANAVIITMAVQGLRQQKDNGDVVGYQAGFYVDVRGANGAWVTTVGDTIVGKTSSAYQRSVRVPLTGVGPFDIRVRRATPESTSDKIVDALFWATMTEVIDARLSYPDSALVAIDVDSELFGSKMPARHYDVKLSIIKVPSNYDPIARTYTGFWDGSFKMAWSDNPAWCFYDLSTHPIIGANNQDVDKWSLYYIGQYCDGLVPDGYGHYEPRFTCNTLFASREEAITTLNVLASVFRGMVYWGAESVMAAADMPGDVKKLVNPSNVTEEGFEYVGTSLRERHSVAVVMWNDPEDEYKQVPELYEDPESIQLFGWRETQVTAACCTSRGQARRLAKWILYSERMETETVTYSAPVEHADLRPGDYIEISDPDRAGARLGGRVKSTASARTITLDKAPPEGSSGTWYLNCVMPSGVIQQRQVQNFNGDVCTLTQPFPERPIDGAVWVLSSLAVVTPMYRVTSVIEQDDGLTYQITATEHDPNKYNFVEFDMVLPDRPDSTIPSGPLPSPTGIKVSSYKYIAGGSEHQGMTISWKGVDDVRCNGYIVEARDPNDVTYRTLYGGPNLSIDEKDIVDGEWLIRIKATTSTGRTSEWAVYTVNIAGLLMPAPPDSIEVSEATFSISLMPATIYPKAEFEFWRSDVPLTANLVESNARRISVGRSLVDVGLKPKTTYYYYVRGTNIYGKSQFVGAQGTTLYNFEDILAALDEDIRKPGGLFEEMIDASKQNTDDIKSALDALKTDVRLNKMLEDIRQLATKTQIEGTGARNTVEEITRITEDEALVARITTLQAQVDDDILAALEEMQFAMADNNEAIAGQILSIKAQINDDILAAMQVEQTARVDADGALTHRLDLFSASTEDDIATVRQEITAQASYTDGAVARAVTTATVNGKSAVFGISVNGTVSEIGAVADRFYIYNPIGGSYTLAFAVVDGRTVIQDALIREASITMAKISSALQSDNYKPNEIGWRLTKAGVFEMNGNTPGEGRLVQTNQTITVSDELETPRVILGKLPPM
jgi:predicted phage tail protein